MRINRDRLQIDKFPFSYEMPTRFSDLDKVGHINHVNLMAFFQEGRNRLFYAYELLKAAHCGLVVAALNIEFAGDLFHPDPIEVHSGVLEIGRSSFRMSQIAVQNGCIGAYTEVVQVARGQERTVPLPQAWHPILTRMAIDQ